MGRYADNILTKNHIPHISIFITAPKKLRIQRTYHTSKEKLTYKQAAKYVSKEDKAHLKRYAMLREYFDIMDVPDDEDNLWN